MVTVQFALAASVTPVQVSASAKSALLVPLMTIELTVSDVVPVFVRVAV